MVPFNKLTAFVVALFISAIQLNSFSQTPGGVNNSSNIRYWFDAQSFLNTSNGSSVSTWQNKGGNSDALSQGASSETPQLRNNASDNINGIPVLRFDGSNDMLDLPNNNDINLGIRTEQTIHIVFRTGNDVTTTQFLYEQGGSTRGISLYITGGQFYSALWNDNDDGIASNWNTVSTNFSVSPNTIYLASLVFDGGTSSNNGNAYLYSSGNLQGTINSIGTLYEHAGSIGIGNIADNSRTHTSNSFSSQAPFGGDIAEFVIATYAQNSNDLELTVDALAAKYNLTPNTNIYSGDNSVNGDHDYEVFGIRQDGSGNANTTSNSGSILSSSNPSNLGNNEFLSIGNDNGAAASWTTTETHDPAYVRIEREWFVSESVGNVGTVTISIDATQLPSTGHAIGLLTDADGDFSSGATFHLASASGSTYNVTLDLNDGDHLTVCGTPGEVSVTSSSQTIAEDAGIGNVTFEYNQTAQTNITVNFVANNGTAISGSDYYMSSGSAIIPAGSTTGTASFSITHDCDSESTEDFTVTITSTTSGSVGSSNTQTISITNVNNASSGLGGTACGLQHWYRPDVGISTVSGKVNQWTDQQNGIPADASSSGNRPTLNSSSNDNTFNFQPYLEFDAANDYLGLDAFKQTESINAVYGFVVFRTDFSGGADLFSNWSFLDYDRSEYFNFYLRGDNGRIGWSFYENGTGSVKDYQGATILNDDRPHIGTFIYDNTLTDETRIFADGALDYSVNALPNGTQLGINSTRYALIGVGSEATSQNGNNNGSYYDGDIAEIVYFNQPLNSKELNIVHSHLGIKYGVDLNMSDDGSTATFDERDYHNSQESVLWDFTDNLGYSNAKAGINRDDVGSLNVTKSTSTSAGSILTIETSSLNNNNSLIWGHNGLGTTYSADVPSGYSERFDRIWKADEVGETGTLTVSFDLTGISNMPTSASDFALLLDDDGSFSNATVHTTGASLSGNVISFSNVDIDDADYFTLALWTSITWNGSNWSNGSGSNGAPNNSDNSRKLIINGNSGVMTSNASVGSVEITTSSDLTIANGITLTVANGIDNEGTISVENGGAILQTEIANTNTGNGNYEIERNTGLLADDTRFQYWSSPIQDGTMGTIFNGANTSDFYYFNESTQAWNSQGSNSTMIPGRGYITTGTIGINAGNETRLFDGKANNGPISISTTSVTNGDNILIGNPYPSAIDNSLFVAANPEITGTLWFWNHSTPESGGNNNSADYATWTSLGPTGGTDGTLPDNYIQSAQGFFVLANSANPTISFTNAQRISGNNTQFFKQNQLETRNRAWLAITNDSNDFNQILIGFAPQATDGIDRLFDGRKFKGHPRLSLYSVNGTEEFSIQAFEKLAVNNSKSIPLGVDAWITGEYTIYLDSLNNWGNDLNLFLEDKLLHTRVNLKEQSRYSFNVDSTGSIIERFYIQVSKVASDQPGGSVDLPDPIDSDPTSIEEAENSFFSLYTIAQEILLESSKKIESILVYDVSGRLTESAVINSYNSRVSINKQGIFIVHVTFDDQTSIKQKVKL